MKKDISLPALLLGAVAGLGGGGLPVARAGVGPALVLICPPQAEKLCLALQTRLEERWPGPILRATGDAAPQADALPDTAPDNLTVTLDVMHESATELQARLLWRGPGDPAAIAGPDVVTSVTDAAQLGSGAYDNLARGLLQVTALPF